jgi:hypothetical protein
MADQAVPDLTTVDATQLTEVAITAKKIPIAGVNNSSWIKINGKLFAANTPNSVFTKIAQTIGVPTTPQTARGVLTDSAIDYMNNNLVHNCDFNFLFKLDLGLGTLFDLIGQIPNAIKNAKNAAARLLSDLIKDFMKIIFAAIKAIQEGLSFDGTGLISISVNKIKQLVADIQDIVDYIAQKIEDVMTVVYFIQDVEALIKWILNLPQQIINMVIGCLNQFKSSLNQAIQQVKSIPGQVEGTINQTINSITSTVTNTFQSVISGVQSGISSHSSNLDATLSSAINNSISNPNSPDAVTSLGNVGTALVDVVHNNNTNKLSGVNPQPQNNVPASSSNGGGMSTGNGHP